jgi:phosphohistidine phosphatase SixA
MTGVRKPSLLLLTTAALVAAGGCDLSSGDDDVADDRRRATDARSESSSARLVERLRRGGHVLAFRHAATDSSLDTTNDLTDCSRQRNLNAEGRRQARSIGRAFRRLGIPVGRVLASPFCRTRDTARLAFGHFRSSRALLSVEFLTNADAEEGQPKGLRRLLPVRPRRGTNTMLISHGSAIFGATGVNPDEGEVVIVAPGRGERGFEIVSRVKAPEWTRLAPD